VRETRGIWQKIANEVAADCFGTSDEIDLDKLKELMTLLKNKEIKTPPYSGIPNAELMHSQMYTVCERL
jgi:hypothetical protein